MIPDFTESPCLSVAKASHAAKYVVCAQHEFSLLPPSGAKRLPENEINGRSETQNLPDEARVPPFADALKAPTYVEDKDSGELRRPHHVDLKTGMYRGRQVLKVKSAEV